jgi:hypothetical protein
MLARPFFHLFIARSLFPFCSIPGRLSLGCFIFLPRPRKNMDWIACSKKVRPGKDFVAVADVFQKTKAFGKGMVSRGPTFRELHVGDVSRFSPGSLTG